MAGYGMTPFLGQQRPYNLGVGGTDLQAGGYAPGNPRPSPYPAPGSNAPAAPQIPGPPPNMQLPGWLSAYLSNGGPQGNNTDYATQIAGLKPGSISPAVLQALQAMKAAEIGQVNQAYTQNKSTMLQDLYGRGMAQSSNALDQGNRLGEFLSRGLAGAEADYGKQYISAQQQDFMDRLNQLTSAQTAQSGQLKDQLANNQFGLDAYGLQNNNQQAQYDYLWRAYQEKLNQYQSYLAQHPEISAPPPWGGSQGGGYLGNNPSSFQAMPPPTFGNAANGGYGQSGGRLDGRIDTLAPSSTPAPQPAPSAYQSPTQPAPQSPWAMGGQAPALAQAASALAGARYSTPRTRPLSGGSPMSASGGGGGFSVAPNRSGTATGQNQNVNNPANDPFGSRQNPQAGITLANKLADLLIPSSLGLPGRFENAMAQVSNALTSQGMAPLGTFGANESWGHLYPGSYGATHGQAGGTVDPHKYTSFITASKEPGPTVSGPGQLQNGVAPQPVQSNNPNDYAFRIIPTGEGRQHYAGDAGVDSNVRSLSGFMQQPQPMAGFVAPNDAPFVFDPKTGYTTNQPSYLDPTAGQFNMINDPMNPGGQAYNKVWDPVAGRWTYNNA